jgi:hypothetical protein
VIRWVIARTEDAVAFRRSTLHALAATRRGAHKHYAANKIGSRKGNFLRDKAADRKAQHIDFRQSERFDESDSDGAHGGECRRYFAGARGDASSIEQNHFAVFGETVGNGWVPVVHGAGVVLVEDQRDPILPAETTISEANAAGLDELCWRSLVSVSHFLERVEINQSIGAVPAVDVENVAANVRGT